MCAYRDKYPNAGRYPGDKALIGLGTNGHQAAATGRDGRNEPGISLRANGRKNRGSGADGWHLACVSLGCEPMGAKTVAPVLTVGTWPV
jgi:hypothetical protein